MVKVFPVTGTLITRSEVECVVEADETIDIGPLETPVIAILDMRHPKQLTRTYRHWSIWLSPLRKMLNKGVHRSQQMR